jgi:flagellar basal body-associated protein FliL
LPPQALKSSIELWRSPAKEMLKDRPEQVHDMILPIFQVRTPEQVLNPNSKLELRREIADKLNELKLKGKILQVDFTDLTIEPAKGVDMSHE